MTVRVGWPVRFSSYLEVNVLSENMFSDKSQNMERHELHSVCSSSIASGIADRNGLLVLGNPRLDGWQAVFSRACHVFVVQPQVDIGSALCGMAKPTIWPAVVIVLPSAVCKS